MTSSSKTTKSAQKVRKLLDLLNGKRSLLIVMQDNPDPDSIAAAVALRQIAHHAGEIQCSITYGGSVGRSENRALMDYLGLNFRPYEEVLGTEFGAVAVVDCQPASGNMPLPDEVVPDIVIDHHPLRPETRRSPFTDVRSKYGAVATILHEYLTELDMAPDAQVATALMYGIRSDTHDLGRPAIQADKRAVQALFPLVNTRVLSSIQRGSVTTGYFRMIHQALSSARKHDHALVSDLGEVETPDILGETADMLIRHEQTTWVLCHGVHEDMIWLSLRTTCSEPPASVVVERMVEGIGTGGGHEMSAGGQVPLVRGSQAELTRLSRTLKERFLEQVGAPTRPSRGLIAARPARPSE